MNVNLTQDQLDLIVRGMTKYARTLNIDITNNFFGLTRNEARVELHAVDELISVLNYETENVNSEIYEEDTKVPTKKAMCPYEEWSPNDPRNW